jgi:EAL domain-containing protein (putative c-di-GMP-specific phosphodiesterase class I)/putative methionine-R-sulfoxide reductase with GAF domain
VSIRDDPKGGLAERSASDRRRALDDPGAKERALRETDLEEAAPEDSRPPAGMGVRSLLEPGAVTMHAQPIVCLADGNVVAFELLARTTFPTELSPDQWLRHARKEGIDTELELAFLEAACARGVPPDGVRVFINLSAHTVMDPRIDELVRRLPPHVIEITEHEPVLDYHQLRLRLQNWPADTPMLAIDDVGSGYSSMSHVLQLRPHFIKVDRALVRGVHRDRNQLAVLKGIVGYARQCGATSLAEGVETHDELAALRTIGVDLVQGFLIGRPGPDWPRPRRVHVAAYQSARAAGPATDRTDTTELDGLDSLAARVDMLTDPREAADEVTTYLYEHLGLLPSVYVERGDTLRFLSGRGQWQVLDGIESGVGLTGAAHATAQRVLVYDVAREPRYREAVPGIVAELAVPLWVDGHVVGILNVDVPTPIDDVQISAVESAAQTLEGAFSRSGLPAAEESPFKVLGQRALRVASAPTVDAVARAAVSAAAAISGLETCGLWLERDELLEFTAGHGQRSEVFRALPAAQVDGLARLVSHVASSYSTGPVFTRAFGPTGALRDQGFGTVLVAAVRSGTRASGVLVLGDRDTRLSSSEVAEAVELLCGLTGVNLTRLGESQADEASGHY